MDVLRIANGRAVRVNGPADLAPIGADEVVILRGEVLPGDPARWASALGMASMRGATVRRV